MIGSVMGNGPYESGDIPGMISEAVSRAVVVMMK